jgi:CHAD domain-containing protein
MNLKKIRNHYKESLQNISAHYNHLLKDFNSDDNHNLRVGVKKLRAFIRLINTSQPDHQSKIPKKFRNFYHIIGDIRNLQLHEQRTKNLCKDLLIEIPQLYLDGIRKEEKCLEKKTENMAGLSFKHFEKKFSDDAPEELSEANKKEFLKRNMERLALLLALPVYFDETFHDIRKVIKDIMYNYDYLSEDMSFVPDPLNDKSFMENFSNALGDFHDLSLALLYPDSNHTAGIQETNEIPLLTELNTHLQLRKEHLKNDLLRLLIPVKNNVKNDWQGTTE